MNRDLKQNCQGDHSIQRRQQVRSNNHTFHLQAPSACFLKLEVTLRIEHETIYGERSRSLREPNIEITPTVAPFGFGSEGWLLTSHC